MTSKGSSSTGSRSKPNSGDNSRSNPGPGAAASGAETTSKQVDRQVDRLADKPRPTTSRVFATYEAATEYLTSRINVEKTRPEKVDPATFKLERMRAMLAVMGNPHHNTKFVHVAGSKGKGSVCEMVASCLTACGYTTGLYTSPHLIDLRERVRINQQMISYADFAAYLSHAATAADAVEAEHGEATFFEVVTALALAYFAEQAVDVAVIEVGLGGRLDSTNVITPEVCAITAIQLEHTQILGDTLEKIAREKAGIMKPGVPVLTIVQQSPSILEVFKQVATAVGTQVRTVGEEIEFSGRFESNAEIGPHTRVCLNTARSAFEHLVVPLKGEHQAANCGLALAVLDVLRSRGFETPERNVAAGLAKTPNQGRVELVSSNPRVIIDGAHNPESVLALMRAIGAHIKYDSMVAIFGCAADKNVAGMLAKLVTGADKIIFTRAVGTPRAMDPRELQRKLAEVSHKSASVAPTIKEAMSIAERAVGRGDLICVTGSFYLAGETKKFLTDRARKEAGPGGGGGGGGGEIEPKTGLKPRPSPRK